MGSSLALLQSICLFQIRLAKIAPVLTTVLLLVLVHRPVPTTGPTKPRVFPSLGSNLPAWQNGLSRELAVNEPDMQGRLLSPNRRKSKRKTKKDARAIRTALKLWSTLYHDILMTNWRNIMAEVYPNFMGILDDHKLFKGADLLFGPTFANKRRPRQNSEHAQADSSPCRNRQQGHNFHQRSNDGNNSRYK
ncbi:hypothetical protein OUZ56_029676 [Daphnia magna]|uniref:Uncharacterized protein n=1 Tax=Daphnia magna TaxID=35525 RepID=A0ABR0B7I1_9CRUS|nr:hypothetical protein OUZ56_029676 [Daphnia magna]